jgi:hypothetical protein
VTPGPFRLTGSPPQTSPGRFLRLTLDCLPVARANKGQATFGLRHQPGLALSRLPHPSARTAAAPVEKGESCTFQITIESQNAVGPNDSLTNGEDGLYQFNVDGAAPSPGPVDTTEGCNCYDWSRSYQPFYEQLIGASYAVTATVTNTTNRQKHSVEVGIGCYESQGDSAGCSAWVGLANLQVAVYTRNWLLF